MRRYLYYHAPVVIYAALIIAVSSIPNPKPMPIRVLAADKLAHLVEYGIFAFLTFRSFSSIGRGLLYSRAFILSAVFVCLFAVFDEYYQRFISGRRSDVYDVVADILGAVLVLLIMWWKRRRPRRAST